MSKGCTGRLKRAEYGGSYPRRTTADHAHARGACRAGQLALLAANAEPRVGDPGTAEARLGGGRIYFRERRSQVRGLRSGRKKQGCEGGLKQARASSRAFSPRRD